MEENRTTNTLRNIKTGALLQVVNKVMIFIVRTVFIKILNTEYLGVNGLFTNILTILSFTELGIGTAIIFNMYKPVAKNDKEKLKTLMQLYKKSYNLVGTLVFIIGLMIIPFMKFIIKDTPVIKENIIFIYILFLVNTSVSYFFTYKKSIIYAHQKQSIINNIDSIIYFIKSILEIAFLVITKNYIVYLLIEIICTIFENLIVARKSNKLYPYLKEKEIKPLEDKEKRNIFSNLKALAIYQFGSVIMNGTDNILISLLINVKMVGLCSNYIIIINSIKTIIASALNGITASIGNLNAIETTEKKEKIFYQMTFVNYMIYSFCAICLICLSNSFIKLWLGNNYVLPIGISISLALSFFIDGLRTPGYIYRTTLGLFNKGKVTPYIGAITNIVFSIILCKIYGVIGIFIATAISQLISYSWIDPYLIHKYEFKTSFKKYIKIYIMYFTIFVINTIICIILIQYIKITGIIGFITDIVIVTLVSNFINIILLFKKDEFVEIKEKFLNPFIKKIIFKIKNI